MKNISTLIYSVQLARDQRTMILYSITPRLPLFYPAQSRKENGSKKCLFSLDYVPSTWFEIENGLKS